MLNFRGVIEIQLWPPFMPLRFGNMRGWCAVSLCLPALL